MNTTLPAAERQVRYAEAALADECAAVAATAPGGRNGQLNKSSFSIGTLCGISRTSWWNLHAQGRTPAPVKLGGSTRWKRDELLRWVDAGCPCRNAWEAMR